MKDFKTMTKTMPKKMLAGAATVVALSGFVPAIEAASPTATANVGVSVIIQQAITLTAGAKVDFGTIILSAVTVVGAVLMTASGFAIVTASLTGEVSLAGGHAAGTMAINSSAGAVNIAVGAAPSDDGGNITYDRLRFDGTALSGEVEIMANGNANVALVGGSMSIGGRIVFTSKPTPGTYNTKSFVVTVTDI